MLITDTPPNIIFDRHLPFKKGLYSDSRSYSHLAFFDNPVALPVFVETRSFKSSNLNNIFQRVVRSRLEVNSWSLVNICCVGALLLSHIFNPLNFTKQGKLLKKGPKSPQGLHYTYFEPLLYNLLCQYDYYYHYYKNNLVTKFRSQSFFCHKILVTKFA